jgi:pimeloyl-ACP methyl ester carboxylesterase
MILSFLSVFFITLGIGQIMVAGGRVRGASLAGGSQPAGYGFGLVLLAAGVLILPRSWIVLGWLPLAGPLALVVLLLGGSYLFPPPHPNRVFNDAGCQPVQIPDDDDLIPGLLLSPKSAATGQPAVCLVPGAGAHKTFFTWRLVQTLLAEGLLVLIIDPPGHGDYRHRSLTYPACLSTIPAALAFLRKQPQVTRVGLIGISLGGALAIGSLVTHPLVPVDAVVVIETPTHLSYTRALYYRELWNTIFGSPMVSLLREMSVKQIWQEWHTGGYQSPHTTGELFARLNPLENIKKLRQFPLLLVYSHRDSIAPPAMAEAMRQAAPRARFIQSKKASHVMLTLVPAVNRQIAGWLWEQLTGSV